MSGLIVAQDQSELQDQGSSEHLTFAAYLSRALLSFASCYCASVLPCRNYLRPARCVARWPAGTASTDGTAIPPMLYVPYSTC